MRLFGQYLRDWEKPDGSPGHENWYPGKVVFFYFHFFKMCTGIIENGGA